VLEKLAEFNPDVHWWIKGDGTDVLSGLWQSASGEWAGDVDLNDGKLQRQCSIFKNRLQKIQCIGLDKSVAEIQCELVQELDAIRIELSFVFQGT